MILKSVEMEFEDFSDKLVFEAVVLPEIYSVVERYNILYNEKKERKSK